MTSYALLLPGQGSQYVGMGKSLFLESAILFEEAESILAFPLKKIMFEGPIEDLTATAIAQPAILLHSIAALHYIRNHIDFIPCCGLGHSLGEYSALVAAQVISLSDALRIVHYRGQLMQDAVPKNTGAMLVVLGMDPLAISECLEEFADEKQKNYVAIANYNGPQQTVIAGTVLGVNQAKAKLSLQGAKRLIELNVSAPFHCALMKPVQKKLAEFMSNITFNDPKFPLISNVSAKVEPKADAWRSLLIEQIVKPVRFTEGINIINKIYPSSTFIEIGPKNVLSGIVKRMINDAAILNIDSLSEAHNFINKG